jgi:hypothetical protein
MSVIANCNVIIWQISNPVWHGTSIPNVRSVLSIQNGKKNLLLSEDVMNEVKK